MADPEVVAPVAPEDVNTPAARLASYIRGGGVTGHSPVVGTTVAARLVK